MRLAQIDNGKVVNVIEVDPADVPDWAASWPQIPNGGPGWAYDGAVFSPPAFVQGPVPDLTFAQMLIGLVAAGWISRAEGEAWLNGVLPAAVTVLIATLPQDQQFPATARAKRPSVINRNDGLVTALAATQGRTAPQMDAFFTTYAAI